MESGGGAGSRVANRAEKRKISQEKNKGMLERIRLNNNIMDEDYSSWVPEEKGRNRRTRSLSRTARLKTRDVSQEKNSLSSPGGRGA